MTQRPTCSSTIYQTRSRYGLEKYWYVWSDMKILLPLKKGNQSKSFVSNCTFCTLRMRFPMCSWFWLFLVFANSWFSSTCSYIFGILSLFIKIKICLWDHPALCVYITHINFRKPEAISTKLGICISRHLSPSQQCTSLILPISLCVYMCISRSFLGNGSVNTFPFLCGSCRVRGKYAITSSQNFLFTFFFKC
jgi:hypothetical protein